MKKETKEFSLWCMEDSNAPKHPIFGTNHTVAVLQKYSNIKLELWLKENGLGFMDLVDEKDLPAYFGGTIKNVLFL